MITIPAALDAGLFDRAEATLLRMLAADPTNARALARLRRLIRYSLRERGDRKDEVASGEGRKQRKPRFSWARGTWRAS